MRASRNIVVENASETPKFNFLLMKGVSISVLIGAYSNPTTLITYEEDNLKQNLILL